VHGVATTMSLSRLNVARDNEPQFWPFCHHHASVFEVDVTAAAGPTVLLRDSCTVSLGLSHMAKIRIKKAYVSIQGLPV
jgi:hypothetical protein